MIELEIEWYEKNNKVYPEPIYTTLRGTANECMDQFLRYSNEHPDAKIYCVRDI